MVQGDFNLGIVPLKGLEKSFVIMISGDSRQLLSTLRLLSALHSFDYKDVRSQFNVVATKINMLFKEFNWKILYYIKNNVKIL